MCKRIREECKKCGGTGRLEDKTTPKKDGEGYKYIDCPECYGRGEIFYCEWCKKKIENPQHGNQIYHMDPQGSLERSCSEYARLEKCSNEYMPRYRKKLIGNNKKILGSKGTNLMAPLPKNQKEARNLINKEFKMLGLNKSSVRA